MAVVLKNISGIPVCNPSRRCLGPHVFITSYVGLLEYLVHELEWSRGGSHVKLYSPCLIECLVKHRELISGSRVWSPKARTYVCFSESVHGVFASLKPTGPTVVKFLGGLLPAYCKLCLLSECHDIARTKAEGILAHISNSREFEANTLKFEVRTLEYLIANLYTSPPVEWGDLCRTSDATPEIKVAVELLWSHLALVYAGNRHLLLCNLQLFFTRPQDSLSLCPNDLRAALFLHGKHQPVSLRMCQSQQRTGSCPEICPVLVLPGVDVTHSSKRTRAPRMYESRIARLCWLAAVWLLDLECDRFLFRWLYRAEPYREAV